MAVLKTVRGVVSRVVSTALVWAITRADPSGLALALVLVETAVTQNTTVAWSIASAAVVGALGVGITVGVFKHTVSTLTKTVGDLQASLVKLEKGLRADIATEETERKKEAAACTKFQADTRVIAEGMSKDVEHLQSSVKQLQERPQSSSPRPRSHETSGPSR